MDLYDETAHHLTRLAPTIPREGWESVDEYDPVDLDCAIHDLVSGLTEGLWHEYVARWDAEVTARLLAVVWVACETMAAVGGETAKLAAGIVRLPFGKEGA
jgi:hypothetical protein